MNRKVFIDTSAWIAYSLSDEPKHSRIQKLIKQFIRDRVVICTSNDIIDETITRLAYNTNPTIVKKFIDYIQQSIKTNSITELWVDEQIQSEAFDLLGKFSDHKLSLTDATSVVFISRFNIESVISLDSDFIKIGLRVLP